MPKSTITLCALCFLLAILFCLGCDDDKDGITQAGELARLAEMEQDVLDFIGEPLCSDLAECRFIAFGDKPCGGPWSYLIYSTSNVDSVALRELVTEYNRYNGEINQRYNLMSDCSVPNPPSLGCLGGRCTDLGIMLPKKNM